MFLLFLASSNCSIFLKLNTLHSALNTFISGAERDRTSACPATMLPITPNPPIEKCPTPFRRFSRQIAIFKPDPKALSLSPLTRHQIHFWLIGSSL